jgi:hypothetical protein
MSIFGPTAIQQGISDHNPLVKDGIICWNLWAPGTRNGIQSETIERNAMLAVKNNVYPNNVADIVKQRLWKQVHYLAGLIIESGKDNIDAICLQEVAYNESQIQVRDYFLAILNQELVAKGLNEFIFSFDSNGLPKSENNISLISKTTGDAFGQLILVNKNKYKTVHSQPLNFVGQQGRIFEIQLEPKNPGLAPRRIWNGHLKWYGNAGNAHHQHLQEIVKEAGKQGATLAADTNAPVWSLCQGMDFIARDASAFANPSDLNTANKVMGKTLGEYVDAIIAPKTAPHLVQTPQIRNPLPAPYIPPQQPIKQVAPRQKQKLAPNVPKPSAHKESQPSVPQPAPSPNHQPLANLTWKYILAITFICGLLAAGIAYYLHFAIVSVALSVSVLVLLSLKIGQKLFEGTNQGAVIQADKKVGKDEKSPYELSVRKTYRTAVAGVCERVVNVDSNNSLDNKFKRSNRP